MKANILPLSRKLLDNNYTVEIKAYGTSMYPFLKEGDILKIEKIPMAALLPSDVIVFERNDKWIAHRFISSTKKEGKIIIKAQGDSCLKYDEDVTDLNYIGKVTSRKRGSKYKEFSSENFYGKSIVALQPLVHYFIYFFLIMRFKLKSLTSFF